MTIARFGLISDATLVKLSMLKVCPGISPSPNEYLGIPAQLYISKDAMIIM
jgi:hypothetical protein